MAHLFLLTAGPVQSFIAQARKTQDLYAGSFLLSHLCRHGLQLAQSRGAKPIFPQPASISMPNRFLLRWDGKNEEELRSEGQRLEKSMRDELENLGQKVLESFSDLQAPAGYRQQLQRHLQIHWVAAAWDSSPGGYSEAYAQVEALLGSVKGLRTFTPMAEAGRKCDLTGTDNALFHGRNIRNRKTLQAAVPFRGEARYMGEGEALGAMAFLKRTLDRANLEGYEAKFPSVGRIALLDTLESLEEAHPESARLKNNPWDEQLLFQLLEHEGAGQSQELDAITRNNTRELAGAIREAGLHATPYYAVVALDGDSMGQWLGGAKKSEGSDLEEFHRTLASKLQEYAKEVDTILDPRRGARIYAGGDDVLALVNLRRLPEVVHELREAFPSFDAQGEPSTCSAGVVVAYYKTPLSQVLREARRMEKAAKQSRVEKDALGLCILRHAGERSESCMPWRFGASTAWSLIRNLQRSFETREAAKGFFSHLVAELDLLCHSPEDRAGKGDPDSPWLELMRERVPCLLKRAGTIERGNEPDKAWVDDLANPLLEAGRLGSARNFQDLVRSASFLVREGVASRGGAR